jgi:hypothetical protein
MDLSSNSASIDVWMLRKYEIYLQNVMADIRICCPNSRILGNFPGIADISGNMAKY